MQMVLVVRDLRYIFLNINAPGILLIAEVHYKTKVRCLLSSFV